MKFLRNPRFLQRLRHAAAITASDRVEAGFEVWKLGRKIHFGEVREGQCTSCSTFDRHFPVSFDETLQAQILFQIHFHPESEGLVVPSLPDDIGDLIDFPEEPTGWTGWIGIGQVTSSHEIRLLVIKKQGRVDRFSVEEAAEEIGKLYFRDLPESYQEEVNKILNKAGFEVEVVSFGKLPKGFKGLLSGWQMQAKKKERRLSNGR